MRSTPVPVGSIFYCLVGAGLIAGATWYGLQPVQIEQRPQTPDTSAPRNLNAMEAMRFHDNVLVIEATEVVLKQSGFSPDRSEFSRSIQRVLSARGAPEYDPKFIGTMGRGNNLKVMIRWRAADQPMTHAIGDDTPWGTLVSASSTQLSFDANGQSRNLSVY